MRLNMMYGTSSHTSGCDTTAPMDTPDIAQRPVGDARAATLSRAAHMLARQQVFRLVATTTQERSVPFVPVKEILLAHTVYPSQLDRSMSDH